MKSQVFKKKLPNEILINFLEKICDKTDTYLLLNKAAYKKAEYFNYLQPFLDELKEYYYKSKQFYLTRKLTFFFFLTIIRQICNYSDIKYDMKVVYVKSEYDTNYYIYIY